MRIHVPPRASSVTLGGAVRRPGDYELAPNGSLRELLELTGGLAAGRRRRGLAPDPGRGRWAEGDVVGRSPHGPGPAERRQAARAATRSSCPSLTSLQDVVEVRGAFIGNADSSKTTTAGKSTIVQRFELAQGERVRDVTIGRAAPPRTPTCTWPSSTAAARPARGSGPARPASPAGREGRDPEHPAPERRRADAAGRRGQGLRRRRGQDAGRPGLPARPDAAGVRRAGRRPEQPREDRPRPSSPSATAAPTRWPRRRRSRPARW